MQNLADVNYLIFCNCLQFVLLVVFSSIRTFTHSSLPHMLALTQLQAHAVLFVGHVVWVLIAPVSPRKPIDTEGGDTASVEGVESIHTDAGVDTAEVVGSGADVADFGSDAKSSDFFRTNTDQDIDLATKHTYCADFVEIFGYLGVNIAGMYTVFAVGGLLLSVAGSVACAAEEKHRLCQITWQSDEGLIVGFAFTIVQVSVAVTSIIMYSRTNTNLGVSPKGLVAHTLLMYSLFVWTTQYILYRYNRIYNKELCNTKYQGYKEMRVYTYIYIGVSAIIIFVNGLSHNDECARRMQIDSAKFILSKFIVLPLAFIFCLIAIGFLCKTHNDTHSFDTIIATYIASVFLLCTTYVRSYLGSTY